MPISWTFRCVRFVVAALGLCTPGCATSTGNVALPSVRIVTREDTVLARGGGSFPSFVVTVVAINQGSDSVYLSPCRAAAERLINGQWVTVYQPVCTGVGPLFTLAAGDSAIFPMSVSSFATVQATPPNAVVAGGEYRLIFGVGLGQPPREPPSPGSYVAIASSTFLVRE
jgi:hypothetical protein